MATFLVYRSVGGGMLGEDDAEPTFVFINEDEVKTGIVVPASDPLLAKEYEAIVTADSAEEAAAKYREMRGHAFY